MLLTRNQIKTLAIYVFVVVAFVLLLRSNSTKKLIINSSGKRELLQTSAISPTRRPNLLIFFVDDWGWGDLGINVGKIQETTETPNMDRFARNGIRFTDFHSASSICTPSRAALLTGRMGLRTDMNR